jgi:hypothetical protein
MSLKLQLKWSNHFYAVDLELQQSNLTLSQVSELKESEVEYVVKIRRL